MLEDGADGFCDPCGWGFVDGQLRLFQIRPFLESKSARGNAYLVEMDQALDSSMNQQISLDEVAAQ